MHIENNFYPQKRICTNPNASTTRLVITVFVAPVSQIPTIDILVGVLGMIISIVENSTPIRPLFGSLMVRAVGRNIGFIYLLSMH